METVGRITLAEFSRRDLSERLVAICDPQTNLKASNLCETGATENNVASHIQMGMSKIRPMPSRIPD
jgi:hypothetical protein